MSGFVYEIRERGDGFLEGVCVRCEQVFGVAREMGYLLTRNGTAHRCNPGTPLRDFVGIVSKLRATPQETNVRLTKEAI